MEVRERAVSAVLDTDGTHPLDLAKHTEAPWLVPAPHQIGRSEHESCPAERSHASCGHLDYLNEYKEKSMKQCSCISHISLLKHSVSTRITRNSGLFIALSCSGLFLSLCLCTAVVALEQTHQTRRLGSAYSDRQEAPQMSG